MTITRRTALNRMVLLAGGVILLPACGRNSGSQDGNDETLTTLEALADTLLPAGTTPTDRTAGAKAVSAHLFALRMIHDCYPKDQQEQFMRGLGAFNQRARDQYGKPFADCSPAQRNALVSAINASVASATPVNSARSVASATAGQKTADLSFFFREYKGLVVQGYLGSQYFLTKIEVYELVPGRWHGCTPVIKKT